MFTEFMTTIGELEQFVNAYFNAVFTRRMKIKEGLDIVMRYDIGTTDAEVQPPSRVIHMYDYNLNLKHQITFFLQVYSDSASYWSVCYY